MRRARPEKWDTPRTPQGTGRRPQVYHRRGRPKTTWPPTVSATCPTFTLEHELGRGSSAVVWRAVLTAPLERDDPREPLPAGTAVAVKLLSSAPGTPEHARYAAALDREAAAGRAISHPNLAAALARGRDAHGDWLIQEFIPGRSLQQVLEADGPLPEPLLRSTLRQLAAALVALHAAGWRHGDLKPANVRLDAEGRAVLLDLGYATSLGRAQTGHQESSGPQPGTLAYLSPEQARGQVPGAASDIFSLGLCAWQLATGQHPYTGDVSFAHSTSNAALHTATPEDSATRADELLAAISEASFVPPSHLVPQLTPFLDHLLRELLVASPESRPSATELLRRLEEQEAGPWWRSRVSFASADRRGSRGEGITPEFAPLVGRRAELARLETAWQTRDSSPFLWIEGQAGMGTSRLAHHFAARTRLGGEVAAPDPLAGSQRAAHGPTSQTLVLYGRCRRLEEERPCQALLRLLQRWLRLPRSTAPGPREAALLAELLPPSAASALVLALAPSPESAPAMAIPEALARWLSALARAAPLLVFIDDIQRADEGTLAVLQRLADDRPGGLLCLLGARTDAIPRRPAALADLRRTTGGDDARLPLLPLIEDDLRALVDALFPAAEPRASLARVLMRRTLGNPGVAVEIMRDLLARGALEPGPQGFHLLCDPEELSLPRSLEEALRRRLVALEPTERLWLQRLAVSAPHLEADFLARAFHAGGLAADQSSQAIGIEQLLARLGALGWLTSTGRRYRFTLPAARELVYGSTRPERRRRLHGAVAAALAPAAGERPSLGDTFRRTWHLRRADARGPLLAAVRELLPAVRERGQHARVHRLCLWGLQALEAPRAESPPAAAATQSHGPAAPPWESAEQPASAPDEPHSPTRLRLELLEAAADSADRLGHRERQREVLVHLADLQVDPREAPDLAGRVYLLHGRQAAAAGRLGLARGLFRNAVELFESSGLAQPSSEALRRLALIQSQVGATEEARTLARRARELATDDPQLAEALLAEGVVDVLDDRLEEALARASRAASALRRASGPGSGGHLGHLGVGAALHLLRARTWRQAGRHLRALAAARRAVRMARAAGEMSLLIESLARQGALLLDTDQVEAAEDSLREAMLLADRIDDRRGQALAGVFLGILLTEAGRPGARAMVEGSRRLAEDLGQGRLLALALAIRARIELLTAGGYAPVSSDDSPAGPNAEVAPPGLASAAHTNAAAMAAIERCGCELSDRIVVVGTQALILDAAGEGDSGRALIRDLRRRMRRVNQRLGDPVHRRRHRLWTTRLLQSVLSPEGPVYPRARFRGKD